MTDAAGRPKPRRLGFAFFVSVIISLAVLVALGNWQVQRLHWKEGLLASIEQRIQSSPVALQTAVTQWQQTADVDYLPVRLDGTFRHAEEQHFLATHDGQSGWYVYAPLQLRDGRVVIVNRGFVPYALKEPGNRPWQPVAGVQDLRGLARNPLHDKPGWMLPDNAPEDRIWYWKDFGGMAEAMNLQNETVVPFFVDLAATPVTTGGPIGGVTRVSLPNRHLEYAITWFGLAAALVLIAGVFVWRDWRRARSSG